jgi:hypothetical protein
MSVIERQRTDFLPVLPLVLVHSAPQRLVLRVRPVPLRGAPRGTADGPAHPPHNTPNNKLSKPRCSKGKRLHRQMLKGKRPHRPDHPHRAIRRRAAPPVLCCWSHLGAPTARAVSAQPCFRMPPAAASQLHSPLQRGRRRRKAPHQHQPRHPVHRARLSTHRTPAAPWQTPPRHFAPGSGERPGIVWP